MQGTNIIERNVPAYNLPDPLLLPNDEKIINQYEWFGLQRPLILEYFQREVYGLAARESYEMTYELRNCSTEALGGKAIRKEVRLNFRINEMKSFIDMLIYLPMSAHERQIKIFLGLNFAGNHTINFDPNITLSKSWISSEMGVELDGYRATQKSRGSHNRRWPVEGIINRGYGLATIYYGDIYPDYPTGYKKGVRSLFQQENLPSDHWGAIATWAWGLQRAMDFIEQDDQVDAHHVAVIGHSRLGKAALWAGALDDRFGAVISNNSGCMGAALSRRCFGETIEAINNTFPHWFCDNFKKYNGKENELAIDQHMLIALIAPRPVYIASASNDTWADPMGEFLAAKSAGKVYSLCKCNELHVEQQPGLNSPIIDSKIGYHIREGNHDLTEYDWAQFLNFLDIHWDF